MPTVTITTLGDYSIIVFKSAKPYAQISYQYPGDLSTLTDDEAIAKVLDSFYNEFYKDKIQEAKIAEIELTQLRQQETIDALAQDVSQLKGGV